MTTVIGVDNGLDGGVCAIDFRIGRCGDVHRYITPTLGTGKRVYDLQRMRDILAEFRGCDLQVFLERAQAMPKQGVSSTFSTGYGYGVWQGLLAGLGLPYEIVSPQTWQKAMFMGVSAGDTKARSALVAQRLQPSVDWRRTPKCKKPSDGLTDAFCIAEWGRRQLAQRGQVV